MIYKWSSDNNTELRKGWIVSGRRRPSLPAGSSVRRQDWKRTVDGGTGSVPRELMKISQEPVGPDSLDCLLSMRVRLFSRRPQYHGRTETRQQGAGAQSIR